MKLTARKEQAFQPVILTLELRSQTDRNDLVNACTRMLETACGVHAQDLAREILAALRGLE